MGAEDSAALTTVGRRSRSRCDFATPVFAQAAIQEPGMYAFYYPNNDVLNGGRPTPATGLDARTLMQLNRRAAGFQN
jgi:hypothetical protein